MNKCVADGTHKAHEALMLPDAHLTQQERIAHFWSLQTQLKGDCAIPVSCTPEPELASFVDIGLPFIVTALFTCPNQEISRCSQQAQLALLMLHLRLPKPSDSVLEAFLQRRYLEIPSYIGQNDT
jgi:hypothetical protein